MGLDNGIVVKAKTLRGSRFLEKYFSYLDKFDGGYELAYWRKCYNVRGKILECVKNAYDAGDFELDTTDLVQVLEVMKYFLDKEHWYEDGGSIWTWEEQLRNTANIIYNITRFLEYIEDGDGDVPEDEVSAEDFEITWYDSY